LPELIVPGLSLPSRHVNVIDVDAFVFSVI